MYSHADFDDPDTRSKLMEYFIDSIYLYEDRIAVKFWFSDDRAEVPLDTLTEIIKGKGKTPGNKDGKEFAHDAPSSARTRKRTLVRVSVLCCDEVARNAK